jgi:hypothetical protein
MDNAFKYEFAIKSIEQIDQTLDMLKSLNPTNSTKDIHQIKARIDDLLAKRFVHMQNRDACKPVENPQ